MIITKRHLVSQTINLKIFFSKIGYWACQMKNFILKSLYGIQILLCNVCIISKNYYISRCRIILIFKLVGDMMKYHIKKKKLSNDT